MLCNLSHGFGKKNVKIWIDGLGPRHPVLRF